MDDTLRIRAQKLRARREETLIQIGKLQDRRQLAVKKVSPAQVEAFCSVLSTHMADPTSGFGKAYLRMLVDEIRLDGNQLAIRGSYGKLADAIGSQSARKPGSVPSFVPDWRPEHESNVRPAP